MLYKICILTDFRQIRVSYLLILVVTSTLCVLLFRVGEVDEMMKKTL